MSRIQILPESISNRIAAGEVVERPASVVKELLENGLDAESSRIIIEVEKGGRSLIRLTDNGHGMSHDDALLAIERYATSKIRNDSDLFSIHTLGFRGEALPSIASVSHFVMETGEGRSSAGTRIEMRGGTLKNVNRIGAPRGTMIQVSQLFYNTPARRKFLKTISTEMGHIIDTVSAVAMGWPHVGFILRHNGKEIKHLIPSEAPRTRAADLLGQEIGKHLWPVEEEENEVRIRGWIAPPHINRTTARGIYLYVNGRYVRDRTLVHALSRGYQGRLMKGQFPVAVLFIDLNPEAVDVNVHPTKSEVRFSHPPKVHDTVVRAVSKALALADRPSSSKTGIEKRSASPPDDLPPWKREKSTQPAAIKETSETGDESDPFQISEAGSGFPSPSPGFEKRDLSPPPELRPDQKPEQKPARNPEQNREQSPLWPRPRIDSLHLIGQLKGTYLLCESEDGLVLIDQHAAHERIIFEGLKKKLSGAGGGGSQRLLIPETIDLSHREAGALAEMIPSLAEAGLEIEPFGGSTIAVKAVPAIMGDGPVRPLITAIAEGLAELDHSRDDGMERAIEASLMLMACHGAIRAHQPLTHAQMKGLLEQLETCEIPSHCPHGRPTWVRFTTRDLEKSFGRIV